MRALAPVYRGNHVAAAAWLALTLTACVTARVEEQEPGVGGTITLIPQQSPEAKEKAKVLMAENCGEKKPKIVKEGFAVVGSETSGNEETTPSAQRDLFSGKKVAGSSTNTRSTTRQVKEWRLTYKCL